MPPAEKNDFPFLTRDMLAFEEATSFGLSLDVVGHLADTLEVRGMTKEGVFKYTTVIAGTGAIENFIFPLPDIPVMVSVALTAGDTSGALAHVVLYLTANGDRISILGAGMVNTIFGVAWPHQLPPNREQSEGAVEEHGIADPVAGANLSFTIPANEVWEILWIKIGLTTSADVANRTMVISFEIPDDIKIKRSAGTVQEASESQTYTFFPGGTSQVFTADASQEVALPSKIILPPGSVITTVVTNIDNTDQIEDAVFIIRRSYRAS